MYPIALPNYLTNTTTNNNQVTEELEDIDEDDPDRDDLLAFQEKLQRQIDDGKLWDLNRKIDRAIDALRCPPQDSGVETLSGVCFFIIIFVISK